MPSEDGYFDESVAARYDSDEEMFDPAVVDPVVDFLAELAGSGRALELGIGTGRIAVPLAQRGVPVHGIDMSRAMVARLREKPGAEKIGVTIGDFATTTVDGTFSVAYLLSISSIASQPEAARVELAEQVRELAPDVPYRRLLHTELYWTRLGA